MNFNQSKYEEMALIALMLEKQNEFIKKKQGYLEENCFDILKRIEKDS